METKHVVIACIVLVGVLAIPLILDREKPPAPITRTQFNDIRLE